MDQELTPKFLEEILKKSNDQFIQDELIPFLKIPSNTLNKEGIEKAREYILEYLSDFCESMKKFYKRKFCLKTPVLYGAQAFLLRLLLFPK